MAAYSPKDVTAIVCTLNSIASIEPCLVSLREAGVGELIVVDASSTDGTRHIAETLADRVLTDPRQGLGAARNIGIAESTRQLILNFGSDNVLPPGQLQIMIDSLVDGAYHGVSAQTLIDGTGYPTFGLNAWRKGRFRPGPAAVIGTPTLFMGDLLRTNPYDPTRAFSDDSELCERWAQQLGSRFGISEATVHEIGKTSWHEVATRCRMYGVSDHETYRAGVATGWTHRRRLHSITHPLRADFVTPIRNLSPADALRATPFLAVFAASRYAGWLGTAVKRSRH